MRSQLLVRIVALWVAFGLGATLGAFITYRHLAACSVVVKDLDLDGLTSAAQSAMPAAMAGTGEVAFTLDPAGVAIHADPGVLGAGYDERVLAVVRGGPVRVEVSTKVLQRLLGR